VRRAVRALLPVGAALAAATVDLPLARRGGVTQRGGAGLGDAGVKRRSFEAEVELGHKGCAIVLPFDPAAAWGRRARHFVRGTLNGVPVEAEIGKRWGRHFSCVDDDLLEALGLAPGDVVAVAFEPRDKNELDAAEAPKLPGARIVVGARRRAAARPRAAKD